MEDKNLITGDKENLSSNDTAMAEEVLDNSASEENNQAEAHVESEEERKARLAEEYDDEKGYKEFVDSLPAKWYVLHTFSGYENVAKENLETIEYLTSSYLWKT